MKLGRLLTSMVFILGVMADELIEFKVHEGYVLYPPSILKNQTSVAAMC